MLFCHDVALTQNTGLILKNEFALLATINDDSLIYDDLFARL